MSARIGILEDDADLRAWLCSEIDAGEGMSIAASCGTLADAIKCEKQAAADLWLVDINLPDGSGLDFIASLDRDSSAKTLILTVLGDRQTVIQALRSGADGYLLKDTPPDELRRFVHLTLAGETPISPKAATYLLGLVRGPEPRDASEELPDLSERELEILRLFSRGLSYREAAQTLGISEYTVGDHVKSIYRTMAVHSRAEALFEARQLGLLDRYD